MRRRDVLKLASSASAAWVAESLLAASSASPKPIPSSIIDTHIHLFDPERPGGVPWPEPGDPIYKSSMPDRYQQLAAPLGVVGAIAIEASPLASDNDWLLHAAAGHPMIVGVVGDLIPGTSDYSKELERLRANPLFLGIRYGNLWKRDLGVDAKKPGFLAGLKELSTFGLGLDSANPNAALIQAIVDVSDNIPELRIVIDHLPSAPLPASGPARDAYWSNLRHLGRNRNVFVKLSAIPVRVGGELQKDPAFYRAGLDAIWDVFGEDHILYGSDWPNSDHLLPYPETLALVRAYVEPKGAQVSHKFFYANSRAAYKWHPRQSHQSGL